MHEYIQASYLYYNSSSWVFIGSPMHTCIMYSYTHTHTLQKYLPLPQSYIIIIQAWGRAYFQATLINTYWTLSTYTRDMAAFYMCLLPRYICYILLYLIYQAARIKPQSSYKQQHKRCKVPTSGSSLLIGSIQFYPAFPCTYSDSS